MELKKLSDRTVKEYTYYLHRLERYSLDQESINNFIRQNNNNVARSFLRNIKQFVIEEPSLNFTTEEKLRITSLLIKPITGTKKNTKEKIVITQDQMKILHNNAPKESVRLMILISYYCSLRADELLKIRGIDFNWFEWQENKEKNGVLKITGKRNKISNVFVPSFLMYRIRTFIIRVYDKKKSGLLFRITYNKWYRFIGKLSEKYIEKKITPHVFRRSMATHLLEKGWDIKEIQEQLRHKDISTTQVYVQISKKHLESKYNEFVNN